jgi:hypothetical protein
MRVTTDEWRPEGGSTARRAGRDSRTGVSRSEFVPTARHIVDIDEAQDKTRTRRAAPVPVPSSTTGGSGRDRQSMHAGERREHARHWCAAVLIITMPPLTSAPVRPSPSPALGSAAYSPARQTTRGFQPGPVPCIRPARSTVHGDER